MAQFTKADIKRAQERLWRNEASKQLGKKVTSFDNILVIKNNPKDTSTLGERLIRVYKKNNKIKGGDYL